MLRRVLVSSRRLLAATVLLQLLPATSSAEPTWSCDQATGSCYYLSDFTSTQPDASCWCRSAGGHLVKIDSLNELEVVRQLMRNKGQPDGYYIGATDHRIEGLFMWEDGTLADGVIPWRNGEPNNSGGREHCVVLLDYLYWVPTYLPDYMAIDGNCQTKELFMCEKGYMPSRRWKKRSRDATYPMESHQSYDGLRALECAERCIQTCLCLSFAHRPGKDGGHCILYYKSHSRLTSPQVSVGYAIYD